MMPVTLAASESESSHWNGGAKKARKAALTIFCVLLVLGIANTVVAAFRDSIMPIVPVGGAGITGNYGGGNDDFLGAPRGLGKARL